MVGFPKDPGKWLVAYGYDALGNIPGFGWAEDKTKDMLGLTTLEAKKEYWTQAAIFSLAWGVAGAPFTFGISLVAGIIVVVAKVRLILTKKE